MTETERLCKTCGHPTPSPKRAFCNACLDWLKAVLDLSPPTSRKAL